MPDPTVHRVPARQAGDCRKALYLSLTGEPESDPGADAAANNRMAAGLALKPVIGAALRREEWRTHTVPPLPDLPVSPTLQISVSGDLVMAHDEITGGQWVTGITLSAKERSARDWLTATTAGTHPHQLRRLALVADALRRAPEPPYDIDPEQPQIVVMLDRDNGELEYELNEPDYLERIAQEARARLEPLDAALQSATVPDAEYRRDSRHCQRCPYLTACHGPAEQTEAAATPDAVTQEQFEAAVAEFDDAEEQLLALKDVGKQRDAAKDVIKRYMVQEGSDRMTLETERNRWQANIRSSKRTSLSLSEARKQLTTEQLAGIATTSVQSALYITRSD